MAPTLSYSGRGRGGRGGPGRGGRGRQGGRHQGGGRYSYAAASSAGYNQQSKSNQWVRPKAGDENGKDGGENSQHTNIATEAAVTISKPSTRLQTGVATTGPSTSGLQQTSASNTRVMTKHGRNQLILTNKKKSSMEDNAKVDGIPVDATKSPHKPLIMLREGKNKLVAVNKSASAATSSSAAPKKGPSTYHKIQKRPRHKSTKSAGPHPKYGAAKRIKVTVVEGLAEGHSTDGDDLSSDDDCNSSSANEHDPSKAASAEDDPNKEVTTATTTTTEKLTDFAYRETSRVRERPKVSRNLHWSKTQAIEGEHDAVSDRPRGSRNMGLVRVPPNKKKTPICPTYLRGLQCQDELCRKRHDVPRDFATPVCSFFLRHGNCLRGEECVFRHVKVNPSAMICPSFSLLGFCEDTTCPMQHVRRPKVEKSQK